MFYFPGDFEEDFFNSVVEFSAYCFFSGAEDDLVDVNEDKMRSVSFYTLLLHILFLIYSCS